MPAIQRVGVAGLGLMGLACASRLEQAGFEVCGYDIDPARSAAFAQAGLAPSAPRTLAATLADLAACEAVVLAVYDTAQVESVVLAEGGLLAAARSGQTPPVVVCISTCDPDRIGLVGEACAAAGLPFIEMPISGTSGSFAKGESLGLVAGLEADIAQAHGVLDALCEQRVVLGAVGNGGRAKLAVNLVLGLNRAAVAEGLVLAERLGLAPEPFLEVLKGSAAASRVMGIKGSMMARRHFEPLQSKVAQSLKDFRLMISQAQARGQKLPFAETYAAMMEDCVAHGDAERDNSLIVESIARQRVQG